MSTSIVLAVFDTICTALLLHAYIAQTTYYLCMYIEQAVFVDYIC